MARTTLDIDMHWVPPPEVVAAKYDEVGDNAQNLHPVFDDVLELMEKIHQTHFARLSGRYVRTGATKASLTGPGPGSVREAGKDRLTFGTDIFYAHYLTKAPKDPEFGQVYKGRRDLRFAVLVMPPGTEDKVGDMLLGHIVEPFE
jgi:hypothetical protein